MEVVVNRPVRDDGSLIVFEGTVWSEDDQDGQKVWFAADHRPAQAIIDALEGDIAPIAIVEEYQILALRPAS